jgi:hypothetical protein
MSTWNNVYKQNPDDDNNPGYGAASIRDLKTNIEGLIIAEHKFPLTTGLSAQGQHKAGSAIVDLTDETIDDRVNNSQIGRLKGSTDVDDKTTLQVLGETLYLDIEGKNQVSNIGDETIAGLKKFTTAPELPNVVIDEGTDPDTISNVAYVRTKTDTDAIIPDVNNVGPTPALVLSNYANDVPAVHTMPIQAVNSENLEEFLVSVDTELSNIRAALIDITAMSPYGQDLRDTGAPTFSTVTATTSISAPNVFGAVWG